jgi:hypothetical protein
MLETLHTGTQWKPTSSEDRELVLQELESILANGHFRGSKRYPALLKHVVQAALDGRIGDLKERTLGIEVFGRAPDYDTSADPVVRFSASEVRKRLAQYYHALGDRPGLQIELPIGSYVPQFFLRGPEMSALRQPLPYAVEPERSPVHWLRWLIFGAVIMAILMVAISAVYLRRESPVPDPGNANALWAPLLATSSQIVVVVGTSHPGRRALVQPPKSFMDYMTGPYHHVSVASAIALAHIAAILKMHGNAYVIKEDPEASLTDLHQRPVILIGATNNAWTMRLVSSLRYRFVYDGRIASIQDTHNPGYTAWQVDFMKPYNTVYTDYAIVARYHDPITESPVMVIAGLGSFGTQAASEFATAPHYLDQILKSAPAGWQNQNVEFVIKSDVIAGKAGPPALVASTVW